MKKMSEENKKDILYFTRLSFLPKWQKSCSNIKRDRIKEQNVIKRLHWENPLGKIVLIGRAKTHLGRKSYHSNGNFCSPKRKNMDSNSTFNSTFDPGSAKAVSIGSLLIGIPGLILNIATVFVTLKSHKLRANSLAPLICALAVSDTLYCLDLFLVFVQFHHNEPFPEGSVWCYVTPILYR